MTFPKANLGASILLVAFSAIYLVQTLALQDSGVSTSGTGPMAYPLTVGVPMAVLSVVLLGATIWRFRDRSRVSHAAADPIPAQGDEPDESPLEQTQDDSPSFRVEAPIIFAITAVHVFLLPVWGYVIGTTLYVFASVLVVRGVYRPSLAMSLRAGLFSVGVTLATYAALEVGLGIPLPQGMIGLGSF